MRLVKGHIVALCRGGKPCESIMTLADTARPNRTLAAAGAILGYAAMISYIDNYVRVIAEDMGLWQFQALRTLFAVMVFAAALALPFGMRLRPVNLRAVVLRAVVQTAGMLVYFGSLAFLTVAQAAAGLFTAPIFVLLIGRLAYGHPLGAVRVVAALAGFAGVLMVLAPDLGAIGPATLAPVVAGAFYAMANIATREWCAQESAATLTLSYMLMMGVAGVAGMAVLWVLAPEAAAGAEGFLLRGPVWPSSDALFWTVVQAVVSVIGVGLMVRAYQLAEASRVSIFEYVILPFSAAWSWVLWGQGISLVAAFGMVLIIVAGAAMTLHGRGGR
jgi:drug/metabolite transporter (DMT)-like permease